MCFESIFSVEKKKNCISLYDEGQAEVFWKEEHIRVKDWPYPPTHCPIYACVLEKSHWGLKYRVLDPVATRVFTVVIVEENFETGRKDCRKGNAFFDSGEKLWDGKMKLPLT